MGLETTAPLAGGTIVGRLEGVAATDRRHLEMQRGVLGMPALVDKVFGRFVLFVNLNDLLLLRMLLAEVSAHPALAILDWKHGFLR